MNREQIEKECPLPSVSYADHSYPAFSIKQMIAFAEHIAKLERQEALEEAAQIGEDMSEPFMYVRPDRDMGDSGEILGYEQSCKDDPESFPVYASPQKPLSDEKFENIARSVYSEEKFTKEDQVWHNWVWLRRFSKAIEKAHGIESE
jgi:hypothetical protein